jgi:hypothetical protein
MQFVDELAAGVVLIRPALQSPDYVAGATGWAIRADGSAEFNNITIRGGAGTAEPLVVGPDGMPQVIVRTTPTNGLVVFPTNRPIEQDAATLNSAVVDQGAADERAELQMTGPTVTGATGGVRVVLRSQPQDGSLPAAFTVQSRDGAATYMSVDSTEVRVSGVRIDSEQFAAGAAVLTGYVDLDVFDRLVILASGEIQWGPGSAGRDVRLYRDAASVLATDDNFRVYRAAVTDNAFSIRLPGDTNSRLFVNADGGHHWGPGNAGSDVSLVRSGPGVLDVVGAITADNIQTGSFQITPTVANEWTANTAVNFPTAFATTPTVVLCCTGGGPGSATTTELEWCLTGTSATGFMARIRRGNLTTTTMSWLAIST